MRDRFNLRLYSEKRHEYVYINTIGYEDGKISYIDILDPSNELYAIEISVNDLGKDYVLECCTGVKDKNGKLIHEGDILKVTSAKYHTYSYQCVDYCNTVCAYWFHRAGYMGVLSEDSTFEIVGNIHENYELLRGGE